jgi:hypothetical protein
MAAADPTARQSDCISTFRANLTAVLTTLSALDHDRLRAASLGGFDAFVPEALAGANADLTKADLDSALASVLKLRAILFDGSGNPTADLLTIARVAR